MRKSVPLFLILISIAAFLPAQSIQVQFIFTADSHYGLARSTFRGGSNVDAHVGNSAMIAKINRMSEFSFPADGGLRSGQPVGAIDFVVDGGDIANRAETTDEFTIQSASASWSQFHLDYFDGLKLLDSSGRRISVYAVPGNHDASNAIGSYKRMMPPTDATSMVQMYNLMMRPSVARTAASYDYDRDRISFSRDAGGIHFVYIHLWPDSAVRQWMDFDLKRVSSTTPVIVFAHDPPDGDSKHFMNPNGVHDLNEVDQFENLLADTFADSIEGVRTATTAPVAEQAEWEAFLRRHSNISGYFHGHNNWNQFYDWTGPHHTVALHTFRVDSPMKGHFSGVDETKLSFQIATIDRSSLAMTVREVLWNADPRQPQGPLSWGASTTVALQPRPRLK